MSLTRTRWGPGTVCLLVIVLSAGISCTDQPATQSMTRPDAAPTTLLTYSGTLEPQGINSYSFTVSQAGEVLVTLLGVELVSAGQGANLTVGLSIGAPSSGGTCLAIQSVEAQGGSRAQITGTGLAGTLCVSIFDVGNLTGPANYTITVATP
jgi:hypothetical protein